MEEIVIPTVDEISAMSSQQCQLERLRLRNEISFARSDEATGGPSNLGRIESFKAAVELIDVHLEILTSRVAA
jgi:hypothetical protein